MATKAQLTEKQEAIDELRKLLKPGDTVYTILRHVSSSGMSRRIDFCILRKGQHYWLSGLIGKAMDYKRPKNGDGLVVGGCGMDVGFHVVHSLGYCLWGDEASKGTTVKAAKLRERIARASRGYLTQCGTKMPSFKKPAGCWFGASGYALNHCWL